MAYWVKKRFDSIFALPALQYSITPVYKTVVLIFATFLFNKIL